jgi:hypothetical protein
MCIIGPAGEPCLVFDRYFGSPSNASITSIELPGPRLLFIHDATVLFWLGLTFLPAVGLLAFGRAVLWVIDGFRK